MKRTIHHIGLLLIICLISCSEVVNLEVEQAGGQLIVFGRVSNSTEGNYVSVHRTGDLGRPPVPVFGANVSVVTADGETLVLTEADSGFYHFDIPGFRGVIGQEYGLELEVNGQQYTTELQEILPQYGKDSLLWEATVLESISTAGVLVKEEVVRVSMTTTFEELPEEFYLRWDLEEAYTYLGTYLPPSHFPGGGQVQCYVIRDLMEQQIFLHNGTLNRATTLPPLHLIDREYDKSFSAKHYFNLIRSSLSKETYDYWEKVDQVVNRQGSIFDTPPAPVAGNIISGTDELVLGYFEAVSVDTTRMLLTNNDLPFFFYNECFKRGEGFWDLFTVPRGCVQCLVDRGLTEAQCVDCNVAPGSGYRRPSYF